MSYNGYYFRSVPMLSLKDYRRVLNPEAYMEDAELPPVWRCRGIENRGSLCYVTSMLQCLMHVPVVYNYLKDCAHERVCNRKACMLCALEIHAKECRLDPLVDSRLNETSVGPWRFLENIRETSATLSIFRMGCAHEFYIHLMRQWHEVFVETVNALNGLKQFYGGFALHDLDENHSAVLEIFDCAKRMVETYDGHFVAETFKFYISVSVAIEVPVTGNKRKKKLNTLSRCLSSYFKPIVYHNYRRLCYETQETKLAEAPRVLVVHLQRNIFRGNFKKIEHHVRFPVLFDAQNYITETSEDSYQWYKLCAVLVHQGSDPDGGHYVAYAKNGGVWYLYDDEVCKEVDLKTVLSQQASMLFYRKSLEHTKTNCKTSSMNEDEILASKSCYREGHEDVSISAVSLEEIVDNLRKEFARCIHYNYYEFPYEITKHFIFKAYNTVTALVFRMFEYLHFSISSLI